MADPDRAGIGMKIPRGKKKKKRTDPKYRGGVMLPDTAVFLQLHE